MALVPVGSSLAADAAALQEAVSVNQDCFYFNTVWQDVVCV